MMVNKTTQNQTDIDHNEHKLVAPRSGLPIRTDLRAGLAWDDLDDQAQSLWNSLTSAVDNLTGGTDAS